MRHTATVTLADGTTHNFEFDAVGSTHPIHLAERHVLGKLIRRIQASPVEAPPPKKNEETGELEEQPIPVHESTYSDPLPGAT